MQHMINTIVRARLLDREHIRGPLHHANRAVALGIRANSAWIDVGEGEALCAEDDLLFRVFDRVGRDCANKPRLASK